MEQTQESTQDRGRCLLCEQHFDQDQMVEHLRRCTEERTTRSGRDVQLYHLEIWATSLAMYWVHIEIPGAKTLADLDAFLRDFWLECCGHLSSFVIGGVTYSVQPAPNLFSEHREKSMKSKIFKALEDSLSEFDYRYDFGSTTELSLRVVGIRKGKLPSGVVRLLARNNPPSWRCRKCGNTATLIKAGGWGIEPDSVLCGECANVDDEMLMPIVNSPRTGVCGYSG